MRLPDQSERFRQVRRREKDSVVLRIARAACDWHMNIFANDPIIRTPALAALEFTGVLRSETGRPDLVHAAAIVSHQMLTEIFIPQK